MSGNKRRPAPASLAACAASPKNGFPDKVLFRRRRLVTAAAPPPSLPPSIRETSLSSNSPLMETASFPADSLFHGAADADADDRCMPSRSTLTPSPLSPPLFSPASLFHGADDSDDDRDEMQVDSEGEKKQALEYVERAHEFPGVKLSVREFSAHELNANLLWPGTQFFATWLVKNQSILDGQRVLELGSGTGTLAIFLRKSFGVDITTSDYDDKEIEDNIAYNCRANNLDVLPHIRHTWGDPFPVSRPDWDIVIASDILLYVKQYDNLVKTVSFLLKEYKKTSEKAGCTTITDKSGTQVPARSPMFLMSWRRRIGKDVQSIFFTGCEKAGLEVHHLGERVYLIRL